MAGTEDRVKRERQRIERGLAFAREVTMGLRADFPDVFNRAWDDGTREKELATKVTALDRAAYAAIAQLKAIPADATLTTLQRLEAFDMGALAAAANGLQAVGDALRAASKPQTATLSPQAPARLAGTSQGPDVALIRGLAPRPARQALGPAPQTGRSPTGAMPPKPGTGSLRTGVPPRPGSGPLARPVGGDSFQRTAGPGDNTSVGARRAFDGALKLAREVLGYVTPRLTLADVALDATGLPGPRKAWPQVETALAPGAEAAGVAPPLRPWLPLLARLYLEDMNATRLTHQAVTHWKQAKGLGQGAEKVDGLLQHTPQASHAALLGSVDAGRLRAAIYPLSHLHVHFKGVPHLSTLFPPPAAATPG